jgi:hypothetical protein
MAQQSFPKRLMAFLLGPLTRQPDVGQSVFIELQRRLTLPPPKVHLFSNRDPSKYRIEARSTGRFAGLIEAYSGRVRRAAAKHVSPPGWSETTLGCGAADRAVVESPEIENCCCVRSSTEAV